MNRRTLLCIPSLALILLAGQTPAGAAGDSAPRNFDARVALNENAFVSPESRQLNEVDRLRAVVPELAATFDRVTGATRTLGARVGYLTGPQDSDPLSIALGFARANLDLLGLSAQDLVGMETTNVVVSRVSGTTHFYFRQSAHGLPLYNGELQIHVDKQGRVLRVSNQFLGDLAGSVNALAPAIDSGAAARFAGESVGLDRAQVADAIRSEGKLMLLGVSQGEARLVWNFQLETPDNQHYYDFNVDAATGQVWTRYDWVNNTEYTVYEQPVESPECTTPLPPSDARTIAVNPEDGTASPLGWFDDGTSAFTIERGNNVHAYPDTNNNGLPDFEVDCGGSLQCNFPIDLTMAPSAYIDAATTNLFYWNNVIHDVQYQYGFDEAGGNFQEDNFANGGVGSDSVNAEAQDGGSTCNANMLTLPDGSNPRMQMYICNNSAPAQDGDLDNLVIVHEYGHGISIRQVGGPANTSCLNNLQQMGEGISDWLGLAYTADSSQVDTDARGVGTYLFGQACTGPGIRSAPYSTDFGVNGFIYGDISGQGIPHGVGFVWATVAWEVYWELVNLHGFDGDLYNATGGSGNQRAMLYHNEGLQTVNCSPTFIDLRDAMLAAAQAIDPADVCPMWDAFARRGLGASASTSGPNDLNPTNGFDVPGSCSGGGFTLLPPVPGTAGVPNDFGVTGATPAGRVFVMSGTSAGTTNVSIPGCGIVAMDFAGTVRRIVAGNADGAGNGTFTKGIPGAASGLTLQLQAVDQGTCSKSNVVAETF